MADAQGNNWAQTGANRLRLSIWHPDCWMLQSTSACDAGLVAYGVYDLEKTVKARLLAYGNDTAAIEELVAAARSSPFTHEVLEMNYPFGEFGSQAPGNATRELLVTYSSTGSIHDAFVSRNLIPDAPIRIRDGREYWTVVVDAGTDSGRQLEEIRVEMNAEITVTGAGDAIATSVGNDDSLTERQREVFETAKRLGYYNWPRETSADALASELDVSKATVLEHLRKAEAKLLDP